MAWAGPRHLAVHDDDLAMQPKVGAAHQAAQQPHRESLPHFDPRLPQPLGLPTLPPRPGSECVDEHAAPDAPLGGPDQCIEHRVGRAALIPDIKLH